MNQETDSTESFLSWQGQVSGPFSLKDIQQLLKVGKIHSLHKIQVKGEWILLREHLAELDHNDRKSTRKEIEGSSAAPLGRSSSLVPEPIVLPEDDFLGEAADTGRVETVTDEERTKGEESKGIAIASFALSCLFFIPFLNLLTWLTALIFGHLASSQVGIGSKNKAATLTWVGLWLSYVELGFFLVSLCYFLVREVSLIEFAFFMVHWQMVGIACVALLGAGILMMAVKLTSGVLIRFPVGFVAALLPSAVHTFATTVVQESLTASELTSGKGIAMTGLVHLILFVGQMFFWAGFIRLPENRELGLTNAALVSLLYTVIFIFIGIGYFVLFNVLTS